jgi:hypothetical protein
MKAAFCIQGLSTGRANRDCFMTKSRKTFTHEYSHLFPRIVLRAKRSKTLTYKTGLTPKIYVDIVGQNFAYRNIRCFTDYNDCDAAVMKSFVKKSYSLVILHYILNSVALVRKLRLSAKFRVVSATDPHGR